MTPAEVLAAAADKLDALASGASDGPWRDLLMGSEGSKVLAGGNTVSTARHIALARGSGDATYIAAMNPLVGRLLAQVLRRFTDACERDSRPTHDQWSRPQRVDDRIPGLTAALDLARLIIGGES